MIIFFLCLEIKLTFGWNSGFAVYLVRPVDSQRPIVLETHLDLLCESC